jgi:hypothetical protein
MPPVFIWLAGAIGAAVVARFLMKEAHRVNSEIDAARAGATAEPTGERRNLRRDPDSGVYRPQ